MANRWGNNGNSDRLIFLGSKIIADGDCSHEIQRHLLLGRKVMTEHDTILKSRDITLLIKIHLVKAMVFPVIMYGCVSWTIRKAKHQRSIVKAMVFPVIMYGCESWTIRKAKHQRSNTFKLVIGEDC